MLHIVQCNAAKIVANIMLSPIMISIKFMYFAVTCILASCQEWHREGGIKP